MSDHLIAEANRHAKALHQMTLPTTKPNQRDIDWYIAECIDLRRQLEYEIEAKRNHLRIACEELNHLTVKTGFYERENAALRAAAVETCAIARVWATVWHDKLSTESLQRFAELEREILKGAQP